LNSSKIGNCSLKKKQFELFGSSRDFSTDYKKEENLEIDSESLLIWRKNIFKHQQFVLNDFKKLSLQSSFIEDKKIVEQKLNPFSLTSSSINFWRSNKPIHNGPAIYFVIDTIKKEQIILYIGETYSADKRWKGEHDCKNYINNYKESLSKNNIESHIDIRFSLDVPSDTKFRRKLEQKLILLWLPPFNKETRSRWSTTFTHY
tara:strand:- start:177 stop:785 length:609 start_codon:yes stop_codon:yes gene_type:complete